VEQLRRVWGDGAFEARLGEALAAQAAAVEEPLHEAEREEVLARLRSLGYVD